jgi:hypothetical protein
MKIKIGDYPDTPVDPDKFTFDYGTFTPGVPMTDRIVKPVRAWAEYDKHTLYWGDRMVTTIPKGADDDAHWIDDTVESVREALSWASDDKLGWQENWGPLRSLRVLYENGYELYVSLSGTGNVYWNVGWNDNNFPKGFAEGNFTEDRDSEAVERAMIAASAWFTQAEGL